MSQDITPTSWPRIAAACSVGEKMHFDFVVGYVDPSSPNRKPRHLLQLPKYWGKPLSNYPSIALPDTPNLVFVGGLTIIC